MANLLDKIDFFIQVQGDVTGENYSGAFSGLKRLSHRGNLYRDQKYRELIGATNPEFASKEAKETAEVFSDLYAYLVSSPDWFRNADYGLNLTDYNVIQEIWTHVVKIRMDALKETQKKAEEATEKLKDYNKSTDVKE